MHLISVSDIIIPENRQRKSFPSERNEELRNSIQAKGLMNPITVRNDGRTLVAGERRLRAMTELHQLDRPFYCNGSLVPAGQIPCTYLAELSPLEFEEAELEENLVRLDLSWQEKAAALDRLYTLRSMQASARGQNHSHTDLIEELTGTREGGSSIRDTLHVAQYLDVPEVAQAKTQKEATQIIKRKLELEHRKVLAKRVQTANTPHTMLHGDSVKRLRELPAATFDLLLTDPPYGVAAHAFGSQAGVAHNYDDSQAGVLTLYDVLASEGFRLCKDKAHAYVFCDFAMFPAIATTFTMSGWRVWPRPLIWNKKNGMLARPAHGPRYTYETILFASKGDRETLCVKPDVLEYGQVQEQIHAAEKPVELLRDLISRSCRSGEFILDPFAGSGSTLEAAALSNCTATLIEINEDNYNMCLERLTNLELEV